MELEASADAGATPGQKADRILGLGMIRRVCERRGWVLHEDVGRAGLRNFALYFKSARADGYRGEKLGNP